MKRTWDLYVSDFGKIKEAQITVNEMMIFVGDNGSGKSYIMTLLWGLINRNESLMEGFDISTLKHYGKCAEWVMGLEKGISEGIIDVELQSHFVNLFNEILALRKDLFVRCIFNGDISINKLEIRNFQGSDIEYSFDKRSGLNLEDSFNWYSIDSDNKKISCETSIKLNVFYICNEIIFNQLKAQDIFAEDTIYFPAARTGFTLAYKTLPAGAVESAFFGDIDEKKAKSVFSQPVVNFLKRWTALNYEKREASIGAEFEKTEAKKADIIKYLEKSLLKGKLKTNNMPLSDIFFIPEGSKEEIPVHMTSSLVTELTPLVLFLEYCISDTIIIEEPEAHLHPKVQIDMAKLLAQLLNNGTNVWITTHSDTLVQQINTLIKLNTLENKEKYLEKYNISEDECIDFNKVGVYEFRDTGAFATVTPMAGNEEGFEYPQFTDTIFNQTNIALDLGAEECGDRV